MSVGKLRKRIIHKGKMKTVVFVDDEEKVYTQEQVDEMISEAVEKATEKTEKKKKSKKDK